MPIKALREFIKLETSSGIVLLVAALFANLFSNTPLRDFYEALFGTPIGFHLGFIAMSKSLLLWINDGLMAIFFLLVGLEIKREMLEGELNNFAKSVLPVVAAVGGMVVPALIYISMNASDAIRIQGWSIPTATDIAFSLGIVALLGSRIPVSLKVFLTALAIFDDIGAIIVIAIFYAKNISWLLLVIALVLCFLLFLLNYLKVTRIIPYLLIGIVLWFCVLKSGVHATLAGIVIAMAIPMKGEKKSRFSPSRALEHHLHPWVAFGVLPIFAFANAGIDFSKLYLGDLFSPMTLGIVCGLFIGKQVGITCASWIAIRMGLARMPRGASYASLYGIGLIAGVGFTMSLFIGNLAFGRLGESYLEMVRLGVIVGKPNTGNQPYPIK